MGLSAVVGVLHKTSEAVVELTTVAFVEEIQVVVWGVVTLSFRGLTVVGNEIVLSPLTVDVRVVLGSLVVVGTVTVVSRSSPGTVIVGTAPGSSRVVGTVTIAPRSSAWWE